MLPVKRDCVKVAQRTLTPYVRVRILLPLPCYCPGIVLIPGIFLFVKAEIKVDAQAQGEMKFIDDATKKVMQMASITTGTPLHLLMLIFDGLER